MSFFRRPPGLLHVAQPGAASPLEYADWVKSISGPTAAPVVSLFGKPNADSSFAIGLCTADLQRWGRPHREALLRLRIHIEAALRLRSAPSECAVARIFVDGRVESLEGSALWLPKPANLVRRMRAIERARMELRRLSGLQAWPVLVDGCWSLVERTHLDERAYLALLNPPAKSAAVTLNDREAGIVAFASQGLSNRHVAYALGLTGSQVSHSLSLVARRMKFRSRAELARHVASQAKSRQSGHRQPLTDAESSVLELVQLGLSNEAIAKARKSSPRTVANQVASLLRKLGASNRRALVVMDCAVH
ncbi:MAG: LuxR C-terminal-related transcriptional regulator [Myxococcales bacterium]